MGDQAITVRNRNSGTRLGRGGDTDVARAGDQDGPDGPENIAAPSSEEGGAAALSQPDVRPKGFEPLTF